MIRRLQFRQVEAFKAVMEQGTVSRAAEALNITQPAVSKLISHLEAETGLHLFDRRKGLITATKQAVRLRDEVQRVFVGLQELESAIAAIKREERGQIHVGVVPTLSGRFIKETTVRFLATNPDIFCAVEPLSSQAIISQIAARSLDVGVVGPIVSHPDVVLEPLLDFSMVCILPQGHALSNKKVVHPEDVDGLPFISFGPTSVARGLIDGAFRASGTKPETVLVAGDAPTVCQFVEAGMGIALVHPLNASDYIGRIVVRPFKPKVMIPMQVARSAEFRNAKVVDAFIQELRLTAVQISDQIAAA